MISGTGTHQAPLSWNSPGKDTGVGSHSLLQGVLNIGKLNDWISENSLVTLKKVLIMENV